MPLYLVLFFYVIVLLDMQSLYSRLTVVFRTFMLYPPTLIWHTFASISSYISYLSQYVSKIIIQRFAEKMVIALLHITPYMLEDR